MGQRPPPEARPPSAAKSEARCARMPDCAAYHLPVQNTMLMGQEEAHRDCGPPLGGRAPAWEAARRPRRMTAHRPNRPIALFLQLHLTHSCAQKLPGPSGQRVLRLRLPRGLSACVQVPRGRNCGRGLVVQTVSSTYTHRSLPTAPPLPPLPLPLPSALDDPPITAAACMTLSNAMFNHPLCPYRTTCCRWRRISAAAAARASRAAHKRRLPSPLLLPHLRKVLPSSSRCQRGRRLWTPTPENPLPPTSASGGRGRELPGRQRADCMWAMLRSGTAALQHAHLLLLSTACRTCRPCEPLAAPAGPVSPSLQDGRRAALPGCGRASEEAGRPAACQGGAASQPPACWPVCRARQCCTPPLPY